MSCQPGNACRRRLKCHFNDLNFSKHGFWRSTTSVQLNCSVCADKLSLINMSSLPDTCRYFRMFCISLQRSHFCVSIWCHVECDETSSGCFVNRICLLPAQQAYSCFLSPWGMILHETNHAFCPSSPQKLLFFFFWEH